MKEQDGNVSSRRYILGSNKIEGGTLWGQKNREKSREKVPKKPKGDPLHSSGLVWLRLKSKKKQRRDPLE